MDFVKKLLSKDEEILVKENELKIQKSENENLRNEMSKMRAKIKTHELYSNELQKKLDSHQFENYKNKY